MKNNEQTIKFSTFIPANAKHLLKAYEPNMPQAYCKYVNISPKGEYVAITDTHRLKMCNIECDSEAETVGVDVNHFPHMIGKKIDVEVGSVTRMVEKEISIYDRKKRCTTQAPEMVARKMTQVTVTCEGEKYVTEYPVHFFAPMRRVIPNKNKDHYQTIRISPENVKGLKAFCKINKSFSESIVLMLGHNNLIAMADWYSGFECGCSYRIEYDSDCRLEEPMMVQFAIKYFLDCLEGCNGEMSFNAWKPAMFEGDSDYTLLMPQKVDESPESLDMMEWAGKDPKYGHPDDFATDAKSIAKMLKNLADARFDDAVAGCGYQLEKDSYTLQELLRTRKSAHGFWSLVYLGCEEVNFNVGNIRLKINPTDIFTVLSKWAGYLPKKPVFEIKE